MRRLPRLDGQARTPMAGSFSPAVERWILSQQRRFDTSRSHVIVTAVSYVAGVEEADYHREEQPMVRRKGRLLRLVV